MVERVAPPRLQPLALPVHRPFSIGGIGGLSQFCQMRFDADVKRALISVVGDPIYVGSGIEADIATLPTSITVQPRKNTDNALPIPMVAGQFGMFVGEGHGQVVFYPQTHRGQVQMVQFVWLDMVGGGSYPTRGYSMVSVVTV